MPGRSFTTTLDAEGAGCAIELPFDPKAAFGKVRAPVRVTLNGYSYRSTVAAMGGPPFVPLSKANLRAAGLVGTETLTVRLELDTAARTVTPPADLTKALRATAGAAEGWKALSFTHQREHVEAIESAKAPETRARRITRAVAAATERATRQAGARSRT
ncbi:MAG: YdeI/OmpD-associated family protein [Vicinamibacterales bacterium]